MSGKNAISACIFIRVFRLIDTRLIYFLGRSKMLQNVITDFCNYQHLISAMVKEVTVLNVPAEKSCRESLIPGN